MPVNPVSQPGQSTRPVNQGIEMQQRILTALAASLIGASASAAEVVVKNDSLTDFSSAAIVWGFAAGEKVASWLTSPCNGDLRAVQIFWRSPSGTSAQSIQNAIEIFRSGSFPNPGALAATIGGPVMTDAVLNEWRFLDENQVIPLQVPVTANETFVVAFQFAAVPTPSVDPSVVRDVDGITANRNGLLAEISPGNFVWFNSASLGLTGDWVIRGVVDCAVGPQLADVGVGINATPTQYSAGQALAYTIVINNAGPVASPSTTVVDIFPAAYSVSGWTCSGTGGATCSASGSGNITDFVSLPVAGQVSYSVSGTVLVGTTGALTNSVTAVVGGGVSDPLSGNNTATLVTDPASTQFIFGNGFE